MSETFRPQIRRSLRLVVLGALIIVAVAVRDTLLGPVVGLAQAQADDSLFTTDWADFGNHFEDIYSPWIASGGYLSIPHARALRRGPTWLQRVRDDDAAIDGERPALAILGLPIDLEHTMLAGRDAERLCLAASSPTDDQFSLCKQPITSFDGRDFGFDFTLCAFNADCWHSTAAAILATGTSIAPELFSIEAIARLPFWNATSDLTRVQWAPTMNDGVRAVFPPSEDGAYPLYPQIYLSAGFSGASSGDPATLLDLPGEELGFSYDAHAATYDRLRSETLDQSEVDRIVAEGEQDERTAAVLRAIVGAYQGNAKAEGLIRRVEQAELFVEEEAQMKGTGLTYLQTLPYRTLPSYAFPLVSLYSADEDEEECCGLPPLQVVNARMLVERGARNGGPLLAINVFTKIADPEICNRLERTPPCVLTDIDVQQAALDYILTKLRASDAPEGGPLRPSIGAILIIAGGPKSSGPCDATPTAQTIQDLRALGVYTFVAAGNDSDRTAVRFPACASAAIVVGALDRDGMPLPESSGADTAMVDLYVDGDTGVIPMRVPPPVQLPGCLHRADFSRTVTGYQRKLADLGYDVGGIDGVLSPQTREAVTAFQSQQGFEPTGRLDQRTLMALDPITVAGGSDSDASSDREYSVGLNLRYSGSADINAYESVVCEDQTGSGQYHGYFAGGSLAGAAVAAGLFLNILDHHPELGTDDLAAAMLANRPDNQLSGAARLQTDGDFDALESRLQ
jgi:hypothetical protein